MIETDKRIFVDAYQSTRRDEEYSERISKVVELGKKIMAFLDPHQKKMFLEYEKQTGLMQAIYLKNVYRIGLEDGSSAPCCSLGDYAQQNAQQNFKVYANNV